jgi:hypothetical protein
MRYIPTDSRLTETVLDLIQTLCADYPRRKRIIECKFRTVTTDEAVARFKRLNDVIDDAMKQVDVGIREYVLSDIACRNGYNKSMASPFISRTSYYRQKNNALLEMAKGFDLII